MSSVQQKDKSTNRFRFSIAALMAAVAVMAVGLAALVNASESWASAVLTLTVCVFFFAVAKAVADSGRNRAFWASFAIIGFGYLYVALSPYSVATQLRPVFQGDGGEGLLTTKALRYLHMNVNLPKGLGAGQKVSVQQGATWWPSTILQVKGGQYKISYDGWGSTFDEWVGPSRIGPPKANWADFLQIGESLWALLFGLTGGLLARYFHAARERKS